ncbi:MAG: SDR family NAD(P)-dependent oxidoreductase [Kangiellaceae bacterium]|jgi:NAD(P)-dependent dehydrogenase (short-subunit alcohol dehydrogenase family)|nr:SDR family NAD(P)-dependent oxidoreductase [Kangiellaceae bacterium]
MKKVLITGSTSGIGRSLALAYAKIGHQVLACGRSQDKLDSLIADAEQLSGTITPVLFDVNNKEQRDAALSSLDNLDIAILNAGDCEYIDRPMEFDGKLFERIINTNLISIGFLIETLLPKLNNNNARPAQLSLVGSSVTYLPLPRAEAYGASKAGLRYLAESLNIDLIDHNIHVSLVSPGFIKTPLTDKNDFEMPFLISSDEAANRIISGLESYKHFIDFPKRFTWIMKAMRILPFSIWRKMAKKNK